MVNRPTHVTLKRPETSSNDELATTNWQRRTGNDELATTESKLSFCKVCGKDYADDLLACPHCGLQRPATGSVAFGGECNACGALLFEADELCPNCGKNSKQVEGGDEIRFTFLEVTTACTGCGADVPINGPMKTARCAKCKHAVKLTDAFWTWICKVDEEHPNPSNGTRKFHDAMVAFAPSAPACPYCQTNLRMSSIAPDANREFVCNNCGNPVPVFPTPKWFRQIAPSAKQVFGGLREEKALEPAKTQLRWYVRFHGPKCKTSKTSAGGISIREAPLRNTASYGVAKKQQPKKKGLLLLLAFLLLGAGALAAWWLLFKP